MPVPLRVLIVEDCPDDADLLLLELSRGGFEPDAQRVETAEEMRAALAARPWDIVLSDYTLPGFGAAEALALCREADPNLPLVVVSGSIGEEQAVRILQAGASDFLLKGSLARLVPAVERELREARNRQARQRGEEALRRALRAAHMVGWSYEPALDRMTRSDNVVEVFGFEPGWKAEEGWALVHPDDLPGHQARIREALADRRPYKSLFRSVHPVTGEVRWLEDHGQGEWDESGRLTRVAGVVIDVTERHHAEEALRLRDRAVRAVSQGILITDPNQPDNPIIYASPGFERLTGYRQDEVLGRNCRFLQGEGTDREAVARVREAIRAGRLITEELLNYRKDGTPFWNELSISPVRDGQGRLTHFVGVQVDVTGRRQLEEQFRQAQKMEAVGRLAGGVAHDFNNFLTIINGYSDLLLQSLPAGDPSRFLVEEIHKAGERSAALTRQLLVFSRKQVVQPQVLDLNEVVAEAEKMLRRMIGEDVRLETVLRPLAGRVKADRGQLEQVLLNLAVNARDAMPTGGRLTIETADTELDEEYARRHPGVRPGPHVLMAVSDSGCGMTEEVQARIFEPFFTTKEMGKGTGLGLAVVHGIVEQAGGHVGVYSEVGVGTTFKLYLPCVEPPVRPTKSRSGIHLPPRGNETVLLVEDEEGVRALSRHILETCGYRVLEAGDGEEALSLATRHGGPIHLLVTDVVIPGSLGGRCVAERLLAVHPRMQVLYVSGYTEDAVVRHGILEEQVHFLQKPFSPAVLAFKVREILDAPEC